ncbi:MAG: glycosyltransferase [Caulobacteraceae bacterium]|nr:glycosyltransferase [Caulobacter sp.]
MVLELREPGFASLRTGWSYREGAPSAAPHLIDTTMLFAPRSGGVKRYLLAKRAWMAEHRPDVRHTLVVPGASTRDGGRGVLQLASARLPFGDGYRWPTSTRRWADALTALRPTVIEAGDPYAPGRAALEAGERTGAPVVGFCHSDPAALAALHLGEWAEPPVRRRWARLFRRFDQVVAPSHHIADRLAGAGVFGVHVTPLGVDTDLFRPERADPAGVRRQLGLDGRTRLLVFAGRPAREKNVDVLLEAVDRLGPSYHLLLVAAGAGMRPQSNATFLDYEPEPLAVARLMASCDAFVHANHQEPFGLIALEAMACGLPMVGVAAGGIAEIVDESVGQLAPRATAAAMAEAITALFERDVRAVGAAARAKAVAHYGWNATFTDLSSLYDRLAGHARPAQVVPLRAH